MSDVVEMRLAVLIDADNVAKSDVKAIVGEVAKYGRSESSLRVKDKRADG